MRPWRPGASKGVVPRAEVGQRPVRVRALVRVGPRAVAAGLSRLDRDRGLPAALLSRPARVLGALTASVAVSLLHPSREVPRPGSLAELVGALFVEFLTTRLAPEATGVVERLARPSVDYEARFRACLGVTLAEAGWRFIDFLADTEDDPDRRLAGTLYGA